MKTVLYSTRVYKVLWRIPTPLQETPEQPHSLNDQCNIVHLRALYKHTGNTYGITSHPKDTVMIAKCNKCHNLDSIPHSAD